MSFKERISKKYALYDTGYTNFKYSTGSALLTNFAVFFAMMVLMMFIADVIKDPTFAMNLEFWHYVVLAIVSVVIVAVAYVNEYGNTYDRTYKESVTTRIALAERMRKFPLSFFAKKDPTDLTVRIMGDCTMQESVMSHFVPQLYASIIYTIIMSVMIIAFDWRMGIAAIWPVPVALGVVFFSRGVQKRVSSRKFEKNLQVNSGIQECLETARDLKINNAGNKYLEKLHGKIDAVEKMEIIGEFTVALFVVSAQLVMKFGIVSTILMGSYLLCSGQLSLMVFIGFIVLISRLYDPLINSLSNLAAALSMEKNMDRIQEINNLPLQTGDTAFDPENFDIVFDHVGFSYDGKTDVLKDVSFTAKQGEVTALIGPSGEGKTTVAKLASRFWDIEHGKICVGDKDIGKIDPETLLKHYSIVFQDVTLFNTSVKENIRIGRKGATDEDVFAAAKAAQCDEFVNDLQLGYDTVIGENGAKLSGGERQRISIARAMLKDSSIVLLDEATASLDAECETHVQAALSELVRDKTVLIVAHRMRTIENAHKVVVLADGKVAEQGTPEELKKKDGIFANMLKIQSSSDAWSL